MDSDTVKIRPDFEPVEDLLIRFQTYVKALDVLDRRWSVLKNGETSDFDRIYSYPAEDRNILEWFYTEGRQLTGDLRHHIELWGITERCPTFKSFIDHLESNWTKFLPELKQEYETMKEKAEKIKSAPTAIVPSGIITFREVLNIFDGIASCVNIAKNTKLYRMEAGEYMEDQKSDSQNITFNAPVGNIGNVIGRASNSQISTEQRNLANLASQKKSGKGILGILWGYLKKMILGNQ